MGIFNKKANKWYAGRKNLLNLIENDVKSCKKPIIWMHCSSLGEFEQGRPLLEYLTKEYTQYAILLTFFSPSGYENCKKYSKVDFIYYLPTDNQRNATRFLQIVQPVIGIFVKYDYWYYYLSLSAEKRIPLLLVSAIFRENQVFFKWYGGFYRQMLGYFEHIFVQNANSAKLLNTIGYKNNSTVAGDTRFDRVIAIAESFSSIEKIEQFITHRPTIIAGSTWPDDDVLLSKFISNHPNYCLIVAPHDVSDDRISACKKLYSQSALYTDNNIDVINNNTLIINSIGILSKLYYYGKYCYVGGGFTKDGIHNIAEAAVYGKPVIFGPTYNKYREAIELIDNKGAFSILNEIGFTDIVANLDNDTQAYEKTCTNSKKYIYENAGATKIIGHYIQENRLLTN